MSQLTAGTWNIDPAHSSIGFVVRHAGISKVRGGFHDVTAQLEAAENISDSVLKAEIQVASIDTGIEARDNHLRSADFFDVEQYPTLTFTSTSFEINGEDLTIEGELTLHGTTKPVTLTGEFGGVAVDAMGTTRTGASVSTTISRKEFGMTWNAAIEAGGVMVSDKVVINIDAEFVAPEA